jgi:ATP/maltotriose-dependent transcriptional regulator MalT
VVDVMLERGALPAVAEKVETLVLEPAFMASTSGALLLETRARLRAGAGRRADAVADLRAAGEIYVALGLGPPFTYWRSSLAHLLPPEDREQARALVEDELARTSASGLARPHGMALRMAATLAAGDDGIERLRESVALLEGSCASLEHARSLVELGAALRRRGNRAEAREPLAEGRELAHRAGAERTLARATEELAASGARPRRIARSGIEALTPSERRVAGLVTGGRSNTEVAQELLVSLKTVETHLSRVYAKFGLSGSGARRQLQRVFAERT